MNPVCTTWMFFDSIDALWITVVLAVYTDDFLLSGCRRFALPLYGRLHLQFGFSPDSLTDPDLQVIVGLRLVRNIWTDEFRRVKISQQGYIGTICALFCEERGIALTDLKPVGTPCKTKSDKQDEAKSQIPGIHRGTAGTHVGRLLWVVRGSRSDAATSVGRLSSRQTRWAVCADEALFRVYRYLWNTRTLCLVLYVSVHDLSALMVLDHMDSDLAGDREYTSKSRTGFIAGLGTMSRTSWLPLVWASVLHDATSRSTAEAETVATWMGTFQGAAPLLGLWEQIVHEEIELQSFVDNDASRTTVEAGGSKKLAYMRKHQHLSISAVSEFDTHSKRKLNRVESASNWSDILTKPLDHEAHWRGVIALGLAPWMVSEIVVCLRLALRLELVIPVCVE